MQLQQATGFSFAYETSGLNVFPGKTKSFKNEEVKIILDYLLDNTCFYFEEKHDIIIIGRNLESKRSLRQIRGTLEDKNTGEKLAGAAIYCSQDNSGTYTDANGNFVLNSATDTLKLRIGYLGYSPVEFMLDVSDTPTVCIKLERVTTELDSILIVKPEDVIFLSRLSATSYNLKGANFLPKFAGNIDLMTMIRSTSGISESSNGSGSLIVRGGAPDQNLVLLDDIVIYGETHLFGLLSSVNATAAKDVTLYKGAFPARYNGRISSVLDISLKDGDPQKYHGNISAGNMASDVTISGPLFKRGKTTFAFSCRKSYHDYYIRLFNKEQLIFNFYDASFKIHHRLSEKDHLYLTGYTSKDRFKIANHLDAYYNTYEIDESSDVTTSNNAAGVKWRHYYSPKFNTDLNISYSDYTFLNAIQVSLRDSVLTTEENRSWQNSFYDLNYRFRSRYTMTENHSIESGLYLTQHYFSPYIIYHIYAAYYDTSTIVFNKDNYFFSNNNANELGFFIEDNIVVSSLLTLNTGLHINRYTYGRKNPAYFSFQPRLTVAYELSQATFLRASYARMSQNLHRLSFALTSLPINFWTPATNVIKPQYSNQVSISLSKKIFNNQLELNIESYFKSLQNMSEYLAFTEGSETDTTPVPVISERDHNLLWENNLITGNGKVYGIEVTLSKPKGNLNAWLSYSLSWSRRRFPEINMGKTIPYRGDRRHNLNLVGVYKLNKGWDVSAVFTFQSKPPGFVFMVTDSFRSKYAGHLQQLEEQFSHVELKTYHRLDIGVNKRIKMFKKAETYLGLSILNVYNRKNNIFYNFTDENDQFIRTSLLPVSCSLSYTLNF